jgi:hypothetical protein
MFLRTETELLNLDKLAEMRVTCDTDDGVSYGLTLFFDNSDGDYTHTLISGAQYKTVKMLREQIEDGIANGHPLIKVDTRRAALLTDWQAGFSSDLPSGLWTWIPECKAGFSWFLRPCDPTEKRFALEDSSYTRFGLICRGTANPTPLFQRDDEGELPHCFPIGEFWAFSLASDFSEGGCNQGHFSIQYLKFCPRPEEQGNVVTGYVRFFWEYEDYIAELLSIAEYAMREDLMYRSSETGWAGTHHLQGLLDSCRSAREVLHEDNFDLAQKERLERMWVVVEKTVEDCIASESPWVSKTHDESNAPF